MNKSIESMHSPNKDFKSSIVLREEFIAKYGLPPEAFEEKTLYMSTKKKEFVSWVNRYEFDKVIKEFPNSFIIEYDKCRE